MTSNSGDINCIPVLARILLVLLLFFLQLCVIELDLVGFLGAPGVMGQAAILGSMKRPVGLESLSIHPDSFTLFLIRERTQIGEEQLFSFSQKAVMNGTELLHFSWSLCIGAEVAVQTAAAAGPATRVVHRAAVFPSQAEKTAYMSDPVGCKCYIYIFISITQFFLSFFSLLKSQENMDTIVRMRPLLVSQAEDQEKKTSYNLRLSRGQSLRLFLLR